MDAYMYYIKWTVVMFNGHTHVIHKWTVVMFNGHTHVIHKMDRRYI